MLDHLSIQCADVAAASRFYEAVLQPLGYRRVMEHDAAIGFGDDFPSFWLGARPADRAAGEAHIAFTAPSREAVDAFFTVAVGLGAAALHEPRLWPEYHPGYYGAFVRDPDGNNVEATHHTFDG